MYTRREELSALQCKLALQKLKTHRGPLSGPAYTPQSSIYPLPLAPSTETIILATAAGLHRTVWRPRCTQDKTDRGAEVAAAAGWMRRLAYSFKDNRGTS